MLFTTLFFCSLCLFSSFSSAENDKPPEQSDHFAKAIKTLEESNQSQRLSGQTILEANDVRKEIIALRAKIRKITEPETLKRLGQSADELAVKLQTLQAKGSTLREESKAGFKASLDLFEQGLVERWNKHIRSRRPILMGDSTALFFAHNTRFRSVHPNMLNKMGTPMEEMGDAKRNDDMSLIVPALAGQNAPPELDISAFQLSREQQYFAHIEVKADQGSDEMALLVPPNTIHKWLFMLSDLRGEPVRNATVEIVGHMPGHVHGLPTQPQVTQELSPGIYLVEGLKFQMKGWWVMQFNILSENAKNDSVIFNLVL